MPKKQTLKEQIKKLCDKFDKSLEPWEEFFPREILSLLKEEKDKSYQDGFIAGSDVVAIQVSELKIEEIKRILKEEKKKWEKENNINTGGHIWAMPTCSRCKREVPFTTDESMIFYEGESLCGECYEKLKKLKE